MIHGRRLVTTGVALVVVVGCSGGSGSDDSTTTVSSPSASTADGGVVDTYNRTCAACHGVDGSGFGPTPPLDVAASTRSFDERVALVRDGDAEVRPAHPAFEDHLSDDEIEALVRYADELGSQPS